MLLYRPASCSNICALSHNFIAWFSCYICKMEYWRLAYSRALKLFIFANGFKRYAERKRWRSCKSQRDVHHKICSMSPAARGSYGVKCKLCGKYFPLNFWRLQSMSFEPRIKAAAAKRNALTWARKRVRKMGKKGWTKVHISFFPSDVFSANL